MTNQAHTPTITLTTNFDKSKRLLNPSEFKAVFDTPVKKIHSTHFLLFVGKSEQTHARLGLAITKKKLKKAVDRNLVKRHAREIFRLKNNELPAIDCVLIVKSGAFVGNKTHKVDKEVINGVIKTELTEIFTKLAHLVKSIDQIAFIGQSDELSTTVRHV